MRVHFICNGNAYRSRMAEAYFCSLNTGYEAFSSGTRADESRGRNDPQVVNFTAELLRRKGIDPSGLTPHPVQLTQQMLSDDDLTVLINNIVVERAKAIVKLPSKYRVWDISDVEEQEVMGEEVVSREEHSERIFEKIRAHVDELAAELL